MLNIRIKASQIGNLTDARYFAAMGVYWMDFVLDPGSAGFLAPIAVKGIKEWVEGPKIVGVFHIQSAEEILTTASDIGLDSIQLGPFFPKAQLAQLSDFELIQELIIEPQSDSSTLMTYCEERSAEIDFFLLDFEKNGINWEQLKSGNSGMGIPDILSIQRLKPIILAMALSPSELKEVLSALPGVGIALKGGAEEKVGFKSYDELDELFEVMEE